MPPTWVFTCLVAVVAVGQYTAPTASKYASRAIKEISEEMFSVDAEGSHNGTCDYNINLMWQTQAESSIFATPLITDLFSDGKKDILIPTATHYVEGLDGLTGRDVGRFPFVHPKLHSQSSILAVDLDHDGVTEYMVSTTNGELVFLTEEGTPIHGKTIRIPGVAINRDWHLSQPKKDTTTKAPAMHRDEKHAKDLFDRLALQPYPKKQEAALKLSSHSGPAPTIGRRLLADTLPQDDYQEDNEGGDGAERYYDRLYSDGDGDADMIEDEEEEEHAAIEIGPDSHISPEARASMDLVFHPSLYRSAANVEAEQDLFKPMNKVHPPKLLPTQVEVDAHILATPVVVDMDADGRLDAVIAVSYYYDVETYKRNNRELPVDDPDNYVASGIVCIDLVTGDVKWSHLLHVTTKHTTYPAFALASPLFVNIDSDLTLDVFITTTQGLVIGFDAKGAEKPGWPVSMAPIMGSPIAVDVNGDGQADICAVDIKGSIGCFNHKGGELLDFQLPGAVVSTPIAADINGDGVADLAVGTTSGLLFAIDVMAGKILPHFPVATGGPIVVTPLAVRLKRQMSLSEFTSTGILSTSNMELVVPSSDGFVYIVSSNGCFETIDLGEKSFSMILADDLTGNGKLDLVVTTVSGTVSVFETGTPFHPLKQWLSKPHSINGYTASEGYLGVYIDSESRSPRDIRGDHFTLRFTIVDERKGKFNTFIPRYAIFILLGKQLIVYRTVLHHPGSHTVTIPAPMQRVYTSVSVIMATPNALRFEDSVSLSFNMHFLDGAKLLLVIPFFLWMLALSFVKKAHTVYMDMDDPFVVQYGRPTRRGHSAA